MLYKYLAALLGWTELNWGKCDEVSMMAKKWIVVLRVTSRPLFRMTLREAGRTRIAGTYSVRFLWIKVVDFASIIPLRPSVRPAVNPPFLFLTDEEQAEEWRQCGALYIPSVTSSRHSALQVRPTVLFVCFILSAVIFSALCLRESDVIVVQIHTCASRGGPDPAFGARPGLGPHL